MQNIALIIESDRANAMVAALLFDQLNMGVVCQDRDTLDQVYSTEAVTILVAACRTPDDAVDIRNYVDRNAIAVLVVTTSEARPEVVAQIKAAAKAPVVVKPYRIETLLDAVQFALSGAARK